MVILLIVLLWIVSIALRITSSGVKTVNRVVDRTVDRTGKLVENIKDGAEKKSDIKVRQGIRKTREDVRKVKNLVINAATRAIGLVRFVVDCLRRLLLIILPEILLLDFIVFLILTVLAANAVLFHDKFAEIKTDVATKSSSSSTSSSADGKSRMLIIGDSLIVQMGIYCYGMDYSDVTWNGLSCPFLEGETSDGDYLYAQGNMGIAWTKDKINYIDSLVDSNTAVIYCMGSNDVAGMPTDEYISFLNDHSSVWEGKGATVYFGNQVAIDETKYSGFTNETVRKFNDTIKAGLNSNVGVIDLYTPTFDMITKKGEVASDGMHYTEKVYRKMLEVIWSVAKGKSGSTKKLSEFVAINQHPDYPTGCETVSLVMTLRHLGFNAGIDDIIDNYLSKGKVGKTDPYKKFVGDPRDKNSYGCFAPVIVEAANKYLSKQKSDLKAQDVSGQDISKLFPYIDKEIPVIIWGTAGNKDSSETVTWNVGGKSITWRAPEHCMVLIGYSDSKIKVADPASGTIKEYDRTSFTKHYNEIHKQAVVIK